MNVSSGWLEYLADGKNATNAQPSWPATSSAVNVLWMLVLAATGCEPRSHVEVPRPAVLQELGVRGEALEVVRSLEHDVEVAPGCGTVQLPLMSRLLELGEPARQVIQAEIGDSPAREQLQLVLDWLDERARLDQRYGTRAKDADSPTPR